MASKTQGLHLLTDRQIKSAKPGPAMLDGGGLTLRITPQGTRSWNWRGRFRGKSIRLSLGLYPHVGLAAARSLASAIRDGIALDTHPKDTVRPQQADGRKLSEVTQRWQRHTEAKGMRSAGERVRILKLHVLPVLGDMDVGAVTKADVRALLDDLRDGKGFQRVKLGAQANRVLAALKAVLAYAYDEADLIPHNPLAGMKPPINEAQARHAVLLSLDDLLSLWKAAEAIPSLAGPITQLLILTGLRREEITGLRWSEVDLEARTITIPAFRYKGKRNHTVPLSDTAVALIEAQPRFVNNEFVFTVGGGRGSFSGWGRAVGLLRQSAKLAHEPWHIHDIRRGVATAWGEHLDAREEITQRMLGQSAKTRMGVTAVYERSDRIGKLRQHAQAWDNLLQSRLAGETGNVVPLHDAGAEA